MARGITYGTKRKAKSIIEWILAAIVVIGLLALVYWAAVGLGVTPP